MAVDLKEWISRVVPDPEVCRQSAAELAAQHPGLSPTALAQKAIGTARNYAVAAGAATGSFASPLTMFPAAIADAIAVLRIEGRLAGVIAALLDPSSLDDPKAFEADIIAIVFPAAASQALRQVTIRAGELATKAAIRKYVTEDMLQNALKFAAGFLGAELTQKAVISKTVPLIGAGIGAAWNWVEIKTLGRRAIAYHTTDR